MSYGYDDDKPRRSGPSKKEMEEEPPQQWFVCDQCGGEGEVWTGRMSHSVNSATIDPPDEIMERCGNCGGAGGWIDDVEIAGKG